VLQSRCWGYKEPQNLGGAGAGATTRCSSDATLCTTDREIIAVLKKIQVFKGEKMFKTLIKISN
jgi:hypothetical protein